MLAELIGDRDDALSTGLGRAVAEAVADHDDVAIKIDAAPAQAVDLADAQAGIDGQTHRHRHHLAMRLRISVDGGQQAGDFLTRQIVVFALGRWQAHVPRISVADSNRDSPLPRALERTDASTHRVRFFSVAELANDPRRISSGDNARDVRQCRRQIVFLLDDPATTIAGARLVLFEPALDQVDAFYRLRPVRNAQLSASGLRFQLDENPPGFGC